MNMLGHDHEADFDELISPTRLLQHCQKKVTTARSAEQRLSPITTASNEMNVAGAVVAL